MISTLQKMFGKIGAEVRVVPIADRFWTPRNTPAVRINVIDAEGKEYFEIAIRPDVANVVEFAVQEVKRDERHLVLAARELDRDGRVVSKDHFLCGFDERHLFVAAVKSVSTVAKAKVSLKPGEISQREVGVNEQKRNRRKTKLFKRQGEWFFIPSEIEPPSAMIRKHEALQRGNGSKPHIAQYAYRFGGELVKVCSEYPNGLTIAQYERLIADRPQKKKLQWRDMRRNAAVFVKGTVRHDDHATVTLDGWHRVRMNTERQTAKVAFLD